MTTRSIGWQSARRFLLLVLGVGILIALLYQHSQEGGRRGVGMRWCRFLRQGHKVDFPMKRTIQHEDTQTVLGRVQGQGCA